MAVTIGTDPELFLKDARTDTVVPVCGLIGGEKGRPMDLGDGFGVQEDNVMLEFNTPPATGSAQFMDVVMRGVAKCGDLIRIKYPHLALDDRGERLFPNALLDSAKARMFGCSPDFDGHKHGQAHTPVRPDMLNDGDGAWRFAGGHVHLGYAAPFKVPDFVVAAFGDIFLGLPAVGVDVQPKRRGLYGSPGRYRPTKYGIEYRVLSNFWVQTYENLENVAVRAFALGSFIEGTSETRMQRLFKEIPWADVRLSITAEDENRAADIMAHLRYDLEMGELE